MYYFYDTTTKLTPPPFLESSSTGQQIFVSLLQQESSAFLSTITLACFLIFNTNSQAQCLIALQLSSWDFHVTSCYGLIQAPRSVSGHIAVV